MTDESIEKNKDPKGLLAPRETPKRGRKKSSNRTIDIDPKSDAGELKSWVCRKCLRRRQLKDFYVATDKLLDSSGYMSVCKHCLNDIFEKFYASEKSLDKALLKMCRLMNVKFDSTALEATRKTIQTNEGNGKPTNFIFGIYRKGLVGGGFDRFGSANDEDLTFTEPYEMKIGERVIDTTNNTDLDYLEKTWGKLPTIEDYEFLEEEYLRWAGPIGNVTHSEDVLIRELCHKRNQIRNARQDGDLKVVDSLIESFQKTLKASGLEPAMQKAAQNKKYVDAWGVWLRDFETLEPAEWYEKEYKNKYRDMDNVEKDIDDIKRSTRNYVTGSRDFNTTDIEAIEGTDSFDDEG